MLLLKASIACLFSFALVLCLAKLFFKLVEIFSVKQYIRQEGPSSHLKKSGTPTMGGVLIIISVLISVLLFAEYNILTWASVFTLLSFAILGGIDDVRKLWFKHNKGLSGKQKLVGQFVLSVVIVSYLYHAYQPQGLTFFYLPYVGLQFTLSAPLFFISGIFILLASSNAVNLTDGLDGLAILPVLLVALGLGILAYVSGEPLFADSMQWPHIPHAPTLIIVVGALIGAGLGFLWFNCHPAQLFMGDVGSLSLGALLGCFALMIRQELLLAVMGGVLVLETLSVIIQVIVFKLSGKRVFHMSPFHHHCELMGWKETKVTVRFWIMSILFLLIGLNAPILP